MSHIKYACSIIDQNLKHALEFGVYKGNSIRVIRGQLDQSFEVFGFDSFEGLPEDWVDSNGKIAGECKKGFFSTSGQVPDVAGVTFFKGWFNDTIPQYLPIAKPIGLIHMDCDLYSSTKVVLDQLGHLIVPGTVICFDEWIYNHNPIFSDHEQAAFKDWCKTNGRTYSLVDYDDPNHEDHERIERQIVRMT